MSDFICCNSVKPDMVLKRITIWIDILIIVLMSWLSSGCQVMASSLPTATLIPTATFNPTYTPAATLTPAPTYTPQPSATLSASATPLPTAIVIPGEPVQVLLEEDFSQGALCFTTEVKGFYLGDKSSQSKVENGVFHMVVDAKAKEIYTSPCLLVELSDYTVQVEIKMLDRSNNYAAGIAIIPIYGWVESSYASGNGLFTFMVNQKGEYCFYTHSDQSKRRCSTCNAPLAGCWAPHKPKLPNGSAFVMKIQRQAERITLYLNDQPVNNMPFNEPGTGHHVYLALAGGWADKAGEMDILFDNMMITIP